MTKEKYKINHKLTDNTFYAAYRVAYLQKIHIHSLEEDL